MIVINSIKSYFQLLHDRPELFIQDEKIPLVLEESEMRAFSEKNGKPMGLVYNNSPYYMVLADLCRGNNGLYSYARVIYCNPKSNGAVAIPHYGNRFGLIHIFRHPARMWSVEFPRGFADKGDMSPEETIRRELSEELGISKDSCAVTLLGNVRADTGLANGTAQAYLAEFFSSCEISVSEQEGIQKFEWVDESELRKRIQNQEITDGFTLSAYSLYLCR